MEEDPKFLLLGIEFLKLELVVPNIYEPFKLVLPFKLKPFYPDSFLRSAFYFSVYFVDEILFWLVDDLVYWSVKFFAGGHANVLLGIVFGIVSEFKNGSAKISSKVGLFDGSNTNIFIIKFLAFSDIVTWSGNEYWQSFIFLYVAFT